MILVVTSKRDGHVEAVARHLEKSGANWVRINTEDFATNIEIELAPASGTGWVRVKDSDIEFRIEDVNAVWYRKPDPIHLSHFEMEPPALEYVEAEFTEVMLGLYSLLDNAYWINNPFATRRAHRKLLQLKTATCVGFMVPRTVLTNMTSAVSRFSDEFEGDLAIKSLGAISVIQDDERSAIQYGVFTRRITKSELTSHEDKIHHMPTLFQEFVEKDYELRITCVEDQIFGCKIYPRRADLTSDDYRFDTQELRHSPVDCSHLKSRLRAYMKALDLNFGCFDFVVSKTGETVFLECNSNGQWLWVQQLTGLQIGEAIANALLSSRR